METVLPTELGQYETNDTAANERLFDQFVGQATFEFGTMLSFVIPGTVIGVSYILAFNVPPIEITGTALVLVVCNNEQVMGTHRNKRTLNILGIAGLALMTLAAVALVVSWF